MLFSSSLLVVFTEEGEENVAEGAAPIDEEEHQQQLQRKEDGSMSPSSSSASTIKSGDEDGPPTLVGKNATKLFPTSENGSSPNSAKENRLGASSPVMLSRHHRRIMENQEDIEHNIPANMISERHNADR